MGKRKGALLDATSDERFAEIHRDPRYAKFPKRSASVRVDPRFAGAFTDPDFQVKSAVSKRGKKLKKKSANDDMRRFYHLDDQEASGKKSARSKAQHDSSNLTLGLHADSDNDTTPEQALGSDDGSLGQHSADSGDEERAEAERRYQRMRGLDADASESSEEDDDTDDDDEEDDDETAEALQGGEIAIGLAEDVELDPAEWGIGAAAGNPEHDSTLTLLDDATHRVAVVDLDWQKMRAVDIFAVLQSFTGKGATLRKVTVYVSDYGKQQMAKEQEVGPQGLRSADHAEADDDDDDKKELSDAHAQERVRMYEKSKLRWYFAIATFDSAASASRVYDECDGVEYEESSARFDLRFVPDAEDFSGREVRDEACDVAAGYEAPLFKSKALQHTKPTLTWDQTDDTRKKALHRKLGAEEIREEEFAAYLASDSEDDAEDNPQDASAIRERYATLLGGTAVDQSSAAPRKGSKSWHGDDDAETRDRAARAKQDMEVTFAPGLENLGKRILEKKAQHKARAGQSLFEQYMQRAKEKKASQRALGKANIESESDSSGDEAGLGRASPSTHSADGFFAEDEIAQGDADDAGFDDPFFNDVKEFDDDARSEDEDAPLPRAYQKKKTTAMDKDKKAMESKQRDAIDQVGDAQRAAELELLMLDDAKLAAAQDGVSQPLEPARDVADNGSKRVGRKQFLALRKEQRKRLKERRDSDDEDFEADINDPRFKAITNPEFALDPTDPHMNRLANPKKLIAEVRERRKRNGVERSPDSSKHGMGPPSDVKRLELVAMVDNLKRKNHKATKGVKMKAAG